MWVKRVLAGITVLGVVLLGIIGCASPPPATDPVTTSVSAPAALPGVVTSAPATAVTTVEAPNDYLIGPQDLLKIEVFGVEDLNRSVRVNSRGQIALPLVGLVQAGGLTGEQLAADIAARLAKDYLQNPQVTIFIEEFTSQRTAVVGAVKTPGVYPLKGRTTLMQVVASAGGTTSVASGTAMVLRPGPDGTRKMLQYDLVAIRDGEAPDPDVLGEDVVHVETSGVKETAKQIMEFILPFGLFAR
ncbi:polysaccharide export protein [Candidatus Competibacter phosphatis]|uniref:Polysaccharide export protein n=1 Tax=Candidatus Competibacter phosphatis TaxID=221280 RepID=A0ABX1TQI1_9GAMM|nr:polysaccharide biosynthesis/export family protein [Candidatus Competibacter phosphatis]NMQ20645.1 polysaccharide export protein [Candidatus Competibacter phosphatis]